MNTTTTIAIDFGTSRTKLACLKDGKAELMRFERDLPYVPSLFYLPAGSDDIVWGYDAEAMLDEDPAGVIDTPKRKLLQTHVWANGRKEAPVRLLARMFADLRTQAGAQVAALNGKAPDKVRLTIPVLYGPTDERRMREAATAAGFTEVEVVPEPVAAARAWLAETKAQADDVIVFDAGGGTIDWAWLRRDGGEFRVVPECPPGGDTRVGGHDLDLEILELVRHQLLEQGDADAAAAIEARPARFLAAARSLKESLVRGTPAPVRIKGRSIRIEPALISEVLNARFITQASEHLTSYLAKVRAQRPGATPTILLVGGSGRLKGLKEAIEAQVGCPTAWWERSEFATVLGGIAETATAPERATLVVRGIRIRPSVYLRSADLISAGVTCVAFHPDGALIASSGEDGRVRILSALTGEQITSYETKRSISNFVCYSPAGKLLAYMGRGNNVVLRDAATGTFLNEISVQNTATYAQFSPNGTDIALSDFENVKVVDSDTGLVRISVKQEYVVQIVFSPNAKYMATVSLTGGARVWDSHYGKLVFEARGLARSAAFSPDSKTLAVGGSRGVWLWDIERHTCRPVCQSGSFSGLAVSPDGTTIAAAASSGQITLWDLDSCREMRVLDGHQSPGNKKAFHFGNCLSFSVDGRKLVSGGEDGSIRLWEVQNGHRLKLIVGHGRWRDSKIAYSPSGRLFALLREKLPIEIVDVISGSVTHKLDVADRLHSLTSIYFAGSDQRLAIATSGQGIDIAHLSSGKQSCVYSHNDHLIDSIAFSENGEIMSVAACKDGRRELRILSLANNNMIARIDVESEVENQAFIGSDTLACQLSNSVAAYQWRNGEKMWEVADAWGSRLAFTPDARRLLVIEHGCLQLLDLSTGRRIGSVDLAPELNDNLVALPSGELVLFHDKNEEIRLSL